MKTRRRFLGALVASAMAIGLLPARAVLGADPETYNVWIGGKQVTSENMDDVDDTNTFIFPLNFTRNE